MTKTLIKLDIGCGQNKQKDYVGIDIAKCEGVDIVHDLFKFPWPIETESVEEAFSSHFFEHVPAKLRFRFMEEMHRILVPCKCPGECPSQTGWSTPCPEQGGKATFITPYWSSMRSIQDPTHEWPPICEASYLYFNRKWRETNKLDHYPVNCDFDYGYGYAMDQETVTRNQETQVFWNKHYTNSISDIHVTIIKRGHHV